MEMFKVCSPLIVGFWFFGGFFVMSRLEIVYFIILFVAGGKAYGLLKNYQEEKLNSVNEVKLQRFTVKLKK